MGACAKTVGKQGPEKHRLSFVPDASSVLSPFGLSSGSKTKGGIRMNPLPTRGATKSGFCKALRQRDTSRSDASHVATPSLTCTAVVRL
jgi:hypothetical protein